MKKASYADLALLLIVTVISTVCIAILPLDKYSINIISYLLLAFFLPGYGVISVFYPLKANSQIYKYVLGALILSLVIIILMFTLTLNGIVSINLTKIFLYLGIVTVILLLIAVYRKFRFNKNLNKRNKVAEIPSYMHSEMKEDYAKKTKNYPKTSFMSLDLILVFLTTMTCMAFVLVPKLSGTMFNNILTILMILFFPGYALVAALYPKKDDLVIYERLSLSFSFPLIGLGAVVVLNQINPIVISLVSILILLSIFTIILLIIAFTRRRRAARRDKYLNQDNITVEEVEEELKVIPPKKPEKISKQYFVSKDLLLIFFLTITAIIFLSVPQLNNVVIRTVLGLLLILFIPGYSLIAALFPRIDDLDGYERFALSVGLSIAVAPLIGFGLNYTPWGVKLIPLLLSLSAFTLIMTLVGFIRRRKVPDGQKFSVNFGGFSKYLSNRFSGESNTSKLLTIVLIFSIILAISTTAYIIVKPKQGESFTEFYLLGPNGKAADYPSSLSVGQNASVVIGIVNHEHQKVDYNLVVTSNGNIISEQKLTVNSDNKVEIPYNFSLNSQGNNKIEFLLYKLPDNTNVYESLQLFVNVT